MPLLRRIVLLSLEANLEFQSQHHWQFSGPTPICRSHAADMKVKLVTMRAAPACLLTLDWSGLSAVCIFSHQNTLFNNIKLKFKLFHYEFWIRVKAKVAIIIRLPSTCHVQTYKKSPLVSWPKLNRKSDIFLFNVAFCRILCYIFSTVCNCVIV